MSKNRNGILGEQSGRIGPVVASSWKGRTVYRSYNPNKKQPNSPKQMVVRKKLSTLSRISSELEFIINYGLTLPAEEKQMTARNMFTKLNYGNFDGETAEELTLRLEDLVLSVGRLASEAILSAEVQDGNVLWQHAPNSDGAILPGDIVVASFFDEAKMQSVHETLKRGTPAESHTTAIPKTWAGDTIVVYTVAYNTIQISQDASELGLILPGEASRTQALQFVYGN